MTVLTGDLNRRAWLVVEIAVAVGVLTEVTIDAMHSFFEMDIVEVHGLAKFVGVVGGNYFSLGVEQVALAIAFEYFAEEPTVTVRIGKLRVAQQ